MQEVPDPEPASLPNEWLQLISGEIEDSGTLVVWSNLESDEVQTEHRIAA